MALALRDGEMGQLGMQFSSSGSLDTQAVGLLAVSAALVSTLIAIKSSLEIRWWLLALGFALASGLAVLQVLLDGSPSGGPTARQVLNLRAQLNLDDGDVLWLFLGDLGIAVRDNEGMLSKKGRWVTVAIALLVIALAAVAAGIGF